MPPERPLFTGTVEHSLDDKGRLVVPVRFRERLGAGFFVTIGDPDPCLVLYPPSAWADVCAVLESTKEKDARYRSFIRHVFGHTEELSCDAQGRLLLPAALRAWAGIEKDVVSIGSMSRVEVWAVDRYRATSAQAEELADYRSELGLY